MTGRLRIQLEHGLRQAITGGSLPLGTVLPPSRVLASELDVSRSLVVGVYEQLTVEGYLEARQGSGTRVRTVRAQPAADDRDGAVPELGLHWPVPVGPDGRVPSSGLPDPALFLTSGPVLDWQRGAGGGPIVAQVRAARIIAEHQSSAKWLWCASWEPPGKAGGFTGQRRAAGGRSGWWP